MDISFKRIIEEEEIRHSDVIALMQCKRLDRIADALERVADSLEALDKCIGFQTPTPYMKEGHHFLRIDGYVETDN